MDGKPAEDLTAAYQQGGRWGWIAGGDYWHPFESHLHLSIGLTYNHHRFDQPIPGVAAADYLTATLGIQLRP